MKDTEQKENEKLPEWEGFKSCFFVCLGLIMLGIHIVVVLFLVFLVTPKNNIYTIPSLNLTFKIEYNDSSRLVYFGEDEDNLSNYFKTTTKLSYDEGEFYLIAYNSGDSSVIRKILFDAPYLKDFHLTDYEYDIDIPDYYNNRRKSFEQYYERLPIIKNDSVFKGFFLVKVYLEDDWLIELTNVSRYMGEIENVDEFIDSVSGSGNFSFYSEMKRKGVPLGYVENVSLYGDPVSKESINVSEINKRRIMKEKMSQGEGWLFLDTITISKDKFDLRNEVVVDKITWRRDSSHWKEDEKEWLSDRSTTLTILYRVEEDGRRIPVSGASYNDAKIGPTTSIYFE